MTTFIGIIGNVWVRVRQCKYKEQWAVTTRHSRAHSWPAPHSPQWQDQISAITQISNLNKWQIYTDNTSPDPQQILVPFCTTSAKRNIESVCMGKGFHPMCFLKQGISIAIYLSKYNYFAFIITDKATISWCCWTPDTPPWLHASAAEPGAECSPSTLSAGEAASIVCGAANNWFSTPSFVI